MIGMELWHVNLSFPTEVLTHATPREVKLMCEIKLRPLDYMIAIPHDQQHSQCRFLPAKEWKLNNLVSLKREEKSETINNFLTVLNQVLCAAVVFILFPISHFKVISISFYIIMWTQKKSKTFPSVDLKEWQVSSSDDYELWFTFFMFFSLDSTNACDISYLLSLRHNKW